MKSKFNSCWPKMLAEPHPVRRVRRVYGAGRVLAVRRVQAVRRPGRVYAALLLPLALMGGTGCTILGAKPWDHDLLAQPAMQVGAYPLQTSIDEHIYFSKEASSGGRSFAGGGCGCN